ncbi:MAG: PQQ-binding-like beta-propeller repeat protein [bacterium]
MRLFLLYFCLFLLCAAILPLSAANWPGWRGDGSGISVEKNLPVSWSVTENVVWKSVLPGEGNSSPVIWGDKIILSASLDGGKKRVVMMLNALDGAIAWQKELAADRIPATDTKNGYASPTPVTDGKNIYVFFDSPGMVALDMAGNLLWTRDLGPFKNSYNQASSPVLYKNLVIENCDQDANSFIVALDTATGVEKWRTPRQAPRQFATPLLITVGGQDQVVVNGGTVISYDPATGKELWRCKGMVTNLSPSAVFANGLVYVTSGRNGPSLAIDPTGRGDISDTNIHLRATVGGPYVPSPLVYPCMLLPGDNGALQALTDTGKLLIETKVPGHFTASPIAGDGKIYWPSEKGDVYVLDATGLSKRVPVFPILAINSMGEKCLASPAIADGKLYIRTEKSLFCIAGKGKAKPVSLTTTVITFEELEKNFRSHPAALGDDVDIRLEVVEALATNSDPRALSLLLEAAQKDPHWDVSEAAVKSLVQQGKQAIPQMLTLISTGEAWRPYLKIAPAIALGKLGQSEAIPVLQKTALSGDPIVRAECIAALGRIIAVNTKEIPVLQPSILSWINDRESLVREAAVKALTSIAGKPGVDNEKITPMLLDAIADKNPMVINATREALAAYHVTKEAIMQDELLYGEQRKSSVVRHLKAGPIHVKFQDGELRYLYVGKTEVLRRIYFAVRDSRWDTVIPELSVVNIDQQENSFTIKLTATAKNDVADYDWTADITGTADGKITFKINGKANMDFSTPRIGLCMLLGTEALAGKDYELLDEKGTMIPGIFPVNVHNDMLANLNSFRTLRYTTIDGMKITASLIDGSFGMEDQRNFGDSSYKAMSGLPYKYPNVMKNEKGTQTFVLEVANPVVEIAPIPTRIAIGELMADIKLPKLLPLLSPAPKNGFMTYNRDAKKFADTGQLVMPYCPALHMPDEDTYMENIPTIVDWTSSLRAALPKANFRIDAITMNSPYLRPGPDARNKGVFGAAWSARVIKYLAMAGVQEASFTSSQAYAGIIQRRLGSLGGAQMLNVAIQQNSPATIDAFAARVNGKKLVWLINLTDQPQQVTITNLKSAVSATSTSINEKTKLGVALPIEKLPINKGEITIKLSAFAVVELTI